MAEMTDAENARLSDLARRLFVLMDDACPGTNPDDVHVALTVLSGAMTSALVSLGPEHMPIVEDICSDIGAELLRQVREAHERHEDEDEPEAGSRH